MGRPCDFPFVRPGPSPARPALGESGRRWRPERSPPGVPCRARPSLRPSWGGPSSLPSPRPRPIPLTVVPGRPPGAGQHVGSLQGVVGGGRPPAALEAVPFDLLHQEGARHGATGGGLGGGHWRGPGGGRRPAGAIGCPRGFQHWTAPGGRAGGARSRPRWRRPRLGSGSRSGSAAAACRQAVAGAVLSTPAAGFIWDAGWRRSGGPLAMELFSALIHQMSPRTIAPHTFPRTGGGGGRPGAGNGEQAGGRK